VDESNDYKLDLNNFLVVKNEAEGEPLTWANLDHLANFANFLHDAGKLHVDWLMQTLVFSSSYGLSTRVNDAFLTKKTNPFSPAYDRIWVMKGSCPKHWS
jgi:hypothetical protein